MKNNNSYKTFLIKLCKERKQKKSVRYNKNMNVLIYFFYQFFFVYICQVSSFKFYFSTNELVIIFHEFRCILFPFSDTLKLIDFSG